MPNLVGIGLSQVPTNSMLGGLAYQSPDHAFIKDLDLKNLSQINSEIADTAVDIFVYDTSKDSDGGAWRKRTTHTSWYNETLGTATRGTRREFPAVAVIVSTLTKVTIYDGDDPDLPMWMVFNGGANGINSVPLLQYPNQNGYHLAALNGILVIGEDTNGDNWGSPIINFISEYIVRADPQGGEGGIFNGGVAQRNDSVGFNSPGILVINNSLIRDVAMIVLPDAYVDPATGLPKPTIAFATSNGVNVVYGDADDTVCTVSGVSTFEVRFYNGGKRIVFREGGNAISYGLLPTASSVNFASWREGYFNETTTFPSTLDQSNIDLYSNNYQELGVTSNNGLTLIDVNPAAQATSAGCYITSDYNTGWMHGDIKGAFLSDTDATNITDANLVSNGDFSNGTTGWSGNASMSVSGGVLTLTSTSGNQRVSQAITVVPGKTYYFSGTTGGNASYYVSTNDVSSGSLTNVLPSTFTVPSGTTTLYVVLYVIGTSNTATFDDIVVKLADPDRSVNNQATNNNGKGLGVFGTVTKSAVATGSELVAYSDWSSSNYLRQPYNSDMEFGTGDFYMMAWIKNTDSTNNQKIITRDLNTSNRLQLYTSGTKIQIYTEDAGSSSYLNSTSDFTTGEWICVIGGRKSGTVQMYVNGKFESGTGSNTNVARDLSFGAGTDLEIGRSNTGTTNYWRGSIALARIGAGFPSAEQIKKIYEDEKHLFQENAACTLYGSSDTVTALAYDEVTEQLHVGTSSGRSDFQGLRRINNTTTAVTTAISAHDEFIVEQ